MADSQEIKNIVEGIVAKVFEKRIAELRKDLQRGVGESLGSRVSELQLDVETGVGELFSSRKEDGRGLGKNLAEALKTGLAALRTDLEDGVNEAIKARAGEIKTQIQEGVAQAIEKRIADLKKDVERAASESAERRFEELRKDVHRIAGEVADKRTASLRQEIEAAAGEAGERRMGDLRKEIEKVVGEVAENRVASIRKDVEKVVSEAGEQRVQELRSDLVNKITSELEPALGGAKTAEAPASALLDSTVRSIQESNSQTDVLRALVDGAAHFSSRTALFVIKGEKASGWQARGFDDNSGIKKLAVSVDQGLCGQALADQKPVSGSAAQFDGDFSNQFGAPKSGKAYVIPLLVRDKIPALLYGDAGSRSDGECDHAAMELLTRSAGLWLEILSLRKAMGAAPESPAESAAATAVVEEPPQAAAAAAASTPAASVPAESRTAKVEISEADEEIHKKAKRFAKLLVDEIKLYNQQKVNEGRQHKDLYSRLREDIEKSRASYDKRYGNTAAANADYFMQEVIRVLAENDLAVMGSGFPHS